METELVHFRILVVIRVFALLEALVLGIPFRNIMCMEVMGVANTAAMPLLIAQRRLLYRHQGLFAEY